MPVSDDVLFLAILIARRDQPINRIMDDYAIARSRLDEIDGLAQMALKPWGGEGPPKLAADPESAIQEDEILCCVCGKAMKNLPWRHLAIHGLTVDEYRRICGYPKNLPLMSKSRLRELGGQLARARSSRRRS